MFLKCVLVKWTFLFKPPVVCTNGGIKISPTTALKRKYEYIYLGIATWNSGIIYEKKIECNYADWEPASGVYEYVYCVGIIFAVFKNNELMSETRPVQSYFLKE